MTPPNPLTELAERVQALTSACRETDCLIFEAGHRLLTPERRGTIDGEPTGEYYDLNGDVLPERAPRYTESLDAARASVPPDHWWEIVQTCAPSSPMRNFGSRNGMFTAVVGQFGKDRSQASNDNPVLAFLSAILRARAASESSHG